MYLYLVAEDLASRPSQFTGHAAIGQFLVRELTLALILDNFAAKESWQSKAKA